jgi:hypothetical protein
VSESAPAALTARDVVFGGQLRARSSLDARVCRVLCPLCATVVAAELPDSEPMDAAR